MNNWRWSLAFVSILAMMLLSACEKAGDKPTPTPDRESVQAVGTLFAQPTRASKPTPTVTPVIATELELNRVIARMEQAVLAQDLPTYMTFISQADPVFVTEHMRWAEDWMEHPLNVFEIELFSIRAPAPDVAQARMTIRWSRRGETGSGSSGGATVSALFQQSGDSWLWAGEDWAIMPIDGIQLAYFEDDVVNNRYEATQMAEYLPGVYTLLTREFDHVPGDTVLIKLYDNAATLQTLTRISQPQITSWNEPGEAIKVALDQNNQPPTEPIMARQVARYLLYDMAGGSHGGFPWWLEDGIAAYGESLFRPLSQRNRTIKGVAALALDTTNAQQLLDWETIGSRPVWDDPARQPVANQAFTLVTYLTETFGVEARNRWIKAVANGQSVDGACSTELGITLGELDAQWRTWLMAQL